jgi:prepilin-type N-terminal cleavage/methylation domain-containing protein
MWSIKNLITIKRAKGFSLVEMLLVLVIVSGLMILFISFSTQKIAQKNRELLAVSMQQILAASLAYYVNNAAWPSLSALTTGNYLPVTITKATVYHTAFTVSSVASTGIFSVSTSINGPTAFAKGSAAVVAGLLPMGYSSGSTVTGQVTIPGQNLNNATAINFAGVYMTGGCVPAPTCPLNMSPTIYVVPANVAGINTPPSSCGSDVNDSTTCTGTTLSPITSYAAWAVGNSAGGPDTQYNLMDCAVQTASVVDSSGSCQSLDSNASTQKYWRVCLTITTSNGPVDPNASRAMGNAYATQQAHLQGNVIAFTRCIPNPADAPVGTPVNVWNGNMNNDD